MRLILYRAGWVLSIVGSTKPLSRVRAWPESTDELDRPAFFLQAIKNQFHA